MIKFEYKTVLLEGELKYLNDDGISELCEEYNRDGWKLISRTLGKDNHTTVLFFSRCIDN
ncbi:MAG: hypothetical protein IJ086_00885 [Clostridium sp.]|nr:hypothetical protein [Clostridium sp.]